MFKPLQLNSSFLTAGVKPLKRHQSKKRIVGKAGKGPSQRYAQGFKTSKVLRIGERTLL